MQEIVGETRVRSLGREDPLEEGMATHSSVLGIPDGSDEKESACSGGDPGSIPGSGKGISCSHLGSEATSSKKPLLISQFKINQ